MAKVIKQRSGMLPAAPHSRLSDADYLAILCHEIGTPLTAIIGLSHILANMECSPKRKSECAEMLRDSSIMLMELMKNMLDSSRLEAGMVEIEDINFNLVTLVQEAVHIIKTRASEKGLDLYVHVANNVPRQWVGDPLRIRQILLNLLGNAIKFTDRGSVSLYVSAKTDAQERDQLCITVADTGIGMDKASLVRIFGKYTQANSSISRNYGGTGLGLSISQDLAHLMKGDITVKSWPGMGSHFVVTLPLHKCMAIPEAA